MTLTKDGEAVWVELAKKYVGQEPTKEAVLEIEHAGFCYTVRCRDGMIGEIYKPCFPRGVPMKDIKESDMKKQE